MAGSAVVVLGGEGPVPVIGDVDPDAVVVAADSGLELAQDLGMRIDHVVGDFDSVDPSALERAVAAGATAHRHDADKDATDSELALDLVVDLAVRAASEGDEVPRLVVIGRGSGRLDHLFADLLQLATARLEHFEVTARLGPAVVSVVRPGRPRALDGHPGEQVSLLATDPVVRGVRTDGLRWPLADADLSHGSTRGVSNEFVGDQATICTTHGTLLAVQPGTVAPPIAGRATPYDPSPRSPSAD